MPCTVLLTLVLITVAVLCYRMLKSFSAVHGTVPATSTSEFNKSQTAMLAGYVLLPSFLHGVYQ